MTFDRKRKLDWWNRPFDTCFNLLIICKEGWSVGLGQEGITWERDCLKCLKRGCNRKDGSGNKDFKKGGKLGQGMVVLKRRGGEGGWNPLRNYGPIKKTSHPLLDYHFFWESFNIHKSDASIKSQPDSQSAYSENT